MLRTVAKCRDNDKHHNRTEAKFIVFEHIAHHTLEYRHGITHRDSLFHRLIRPLFRHRMVKISAAFDLGFIDFLIDGIALQQVFMGIKPIDPASIQH